MQLAKDVLADAGMSVPLLRAGVSLDGHYRAALLDSGVHSVYVNDALSRDIEVCPALSEETRTVTARALARSFEEVSERLAKQRPLSTTTVADLSSAAAMICEDVARADHALLALTDMAASDAYTLQHSIDVAALGVLIGRRHFREHGRPAPGGKRSFDRIEPFLVKLGVGLLLHDIGKLAVPVSILQKPGRLTDAEFQVMRGHPLLGLDLLAGDLVGPLAKSVIRSHHERWNASGYPQRLGGHEITEFARIAAVADCFDAITSNRVYSAGAPAHIGVQAIISGSGTLFDPAIVETFRKVVAPFPAGSEIELSDGSRGIVVSVPVNKIDHPLVRVIRSVDGRALEPFEVDTREQPALLPKLSRHAA